MSSGNVVFSFVLADPTCRCVRFREKLKERVKSAPVPQMTRLTTCSHAVTRASNRYWVSSVNQGVGWRRA